MTRLTLPASAFWRVMGTMLAAIVVYLPVHALVSTWGGAAIGPMWLWKGAKDAVIAMLCLAVLVWLLRNKRFKSTFALPYIPFLCTYMIIVLVATALGSAQTDAKLAGIAMDTRYLLAFGLALLIGHFAPVVRDKWLAQAPRFLVTAGLMLAALGVLQVTLLPLDAFSRFGYSKETSIAPYVLIDDNPNAPRAFATLRGPNDYGAYLLLPLAVVLAMVAGLRDKIMLALPLLAGLFASASRSAWLGALATSATVWLNVRQISRKHAVMLGGMAVALGIAILIVALEVPAVRLAVFHSSPGDTSLTEGSTDAHWKATAGGMRRVAVDPVDGCGAGCAGPASYYSGSPLISENYYVQIAETYGIIGLAVWAIIFISVMRGLWRSESLLGSALFASGVGLAVIGLWLHVWSDDPLSITWWASAGLVLARDMPLAKRPLSRYSNKVKDETKNSKKPVAKAAAK